MSRFSKDVNCIFASISWAQLPKQISFSRSPEAHVILKLPVCLRVAFSWHEIHRQSILDGKHTVVVEVPRVGVEDLCHDGLVSLGNDLKNLLVIHFLGL